MPHGEQTIGIHARTQEDARGATRRLQGRGDDDPTAEPHLEVPSPAGGLYGDDDKVLL
jgi:hypothetical protein